MDVIMDAYVIMDVIMDVIMVDNSVIMGLRDTLFAIITFVIMEYNGVIMPVETVLGLLIMMKLHPIMPVIVCHNGVKIVPRFADAKRWRRNRDLPRVHWPECPRRDAPPAAGRREPHWQARGLQVLAAAITSATVYWQMLAFGTTSVHLVLIQCTSHFKLVPGWDSESARTSAADSDSESLYPHWARFVTACAR